MKRRETFSSSEEADYFVSKGLFREIPRSTIELMSTMDLKKDAELRLAIPREREVDIFLTFLLNSQNKSQI